MKRYFMFGLLLMALSVKAQNHPYSNRYDRDWQYYDQAFYDHAYHYFPDDYYYEFPNDYYPWEYYESHYHDYRQSIIGVDWERVVTELGLNSIQIRQIRMLNNRFSDFTFWYDYYGANPERWYYDRFYALEHILGTRAFIVFQNRYYNGYAPIVYFQNHRKRYYLRRYRPVRKYRGIDINVYNVGREHYFQNYGSRRREESPFRSNGFKNSVNEGFRNSNGMSEKNQGYSNGVIRERNERKSDKGRDSERKKSHDNGFRNKDKQPYQKESGGFRTGRSEAPSRVNDSPRENKSGNRGFDSSGGFR